MEGKAGFRLVLGPPPALEDAFLAAVAAIRGREPLAPVDVLVGGVLQRPYLQRRIAETAPGLLNVRFSTVGEWSRWWWEHPDDFGLIDGLVYPSAHNSEAEVVLYERARAALSLPRGTTRP